MADSTIGALAAVVEAAIGELPGIADLYDDSLLAVEQQGEARHMTGRQWKAYAQAGVKTYVEAAQKAAEDALEAVEKVSDAKASADAAEASAIRAEKAKNDVLKAAFFVDAENGHLYRSMEE